MYLERSLHYRREGKVGQWRGWRRRCLWTRVLRVLRLSELGKMEAGREFQFLEVIGTNVLANEVKWSGTFLIWPRKSVGNRRIAQSTLWLELLTLTHQSTCRDSIYSRGESAETFLRCASESRESVRAEPSINLMARFWIVSRVVREYFEAPLHRWEPYSRQGQIWAL